MKVIDKKCSNLLEEYDKKTEIDIQNKIMLYNDSLQSMKECYERLSGKEITTKQKEKKDLIKSFNQESTKKNLKAQNYEDLLVIEQNAAQ